MLALLAPPRVAFAVMAGVAFFRPCACFLCRSRRHGASQTHACGVPARPRRERRFLHGSRAVRRPAVTGEIGGSIPSRAACHGSAAVARRAHTPEAVGSNPSRDPAFPRARRACDSS